MHDSATPCIAGSRMTRTVLHCIKSEFVGVLEMAGFGILPGRLKTELADLLLNGTYTDSVVFY